MRCKLYGIVRGGGVYGGGRREMLRCTTSLFRSSMTRLQRYGDPRVTIRDDCLSICCIPQVRGGWYAVQTLRYCAGWWGIRWW